MCPTRTRSGCRATSVSAGPKPAFVGLIDAQIAIMERKRRWPCGRSHGDGLSGKVRDFLRAGESAAAGEAPEGLDATGDRSCGPRFVAILVAAAAAVAFRLRNASAAPDEFAIHEDVVDDGKSDSPGIFGADDVRTLVDDQFDALDPAVRRDGWERRSRGIREAHARPFRRILRRRSRDSIAAAADEVGRAGPGAVASDDVEPRR